jgi:hypothetical protein
MFSSSCRGPAYTGKDGERRQHLEKYESNFPLVERVKNFYIIVKGIIWFFPQVGV